MYLPSQTYWTWTYGKNRHHIRLQHEEMYQNAQYTRHIFLWKWIIVRWTLCTEEVWDCSINSWLLLHLLKFWHWTFKVIDSLCLNICNLIIRIILTNNSGRLTIYRCAPISTGSVSVVSVIHSGPQKNFKIKEINGSWVSKRPPSENGL
jgi:hypothetical protein